MTKTIHLSKNLDCCGQIFKKDLKSIKKLGYQVLICARPDREEINQPKSQELQALAIAIGLKYEHIPFKNYLLEPKQSSAFCQRCENLRKKHKVLAFCRSGTRISEAWTLSNWQNPTSDKS